MSDERTKQIYDEAEFGLSVGRGLRPGILVVDFSCGFTSPGSRLGSDLTLQVQATRRLLGAARAKRLPVIFTTVGFEPSLKDAGIWLRKMPALAELTLGERWVEIDPRLEPKPDETIVVKTGASAFFGTSLATILVSQKIDTVVLCGATTSGCIRATVVDLVQHGYPTLVPRECVGDRADAPHEANLFDIQAKYADVVSLDETLDYLESVASDVAEGDLRTAS